MENRFQERGAIKKFYDDEYYQNARVGIDRTRSLPWHARLIASRLHVPSGASILDVACGRGEWLAYLRQRKCEITGTDISTTAIEYCRLNLASERFVVCPAEMLPFKDGSFDLITCLGSLEHFIDKPAALREMVRVATPKAKFLLLVPNSGFITRRLGLYKGTNQARVREDVLSLAEWEKMFRESGLKVRFRWRDLHMMTFTWICRGQSPIMRIARTLQVLALIFFPIAWQYQVYHYCERK